MKIFALLLAIALLLALPGCGAETGLLAGVTASERGEASDAAELAADFTVELFNATGNLVDRIDGAQGSVSFQPAAPGLYLIRVTSGGTVKTYKVVK